MASSWAVSRENAKAASQKELLEAGLYTGREIADIERSFRRNIAENVQDVALRLIYADWLEESGRGEEALVLRLVAANKAVDGDEEWSGWVRHADGKPAEYGEKITDATHRFERRRLFTPGRWSVVRRITEGANGGHRQHTVRWERITITVVRCTKASAVLDTGKQIRLNTLTSCVRLDA